MYSLLGRMGGGLRNPTTDGGTVGGHPYPYPMPEAKSSSVYTVVARARAAARFLPEEGFEFTLMSAPDLFGPTRVRISTRYVDGGHTNPLPRELSIEIFGPAPSLDMAINGFSAVAHAFALTWILHAFEGVAACEIAKVPVLQGQ